MPHRSYTRTAKYSSTVQYGTVLYTFRGRKASARSHLFDTDLVNLNGFNGRAALKEADQEGTAQYSTAQYSTGTVQYSIVQHSTVQYSTVHTRARMPTRTALAHKHTFPQARTCPCKYSAVQHCTHSTHAHTVQYSLQ